MIDWMSDVRFEDSFVVEGGNFRVAGNVSGKIKRILKGIGVNDTIIRRVAIVTYEAEINIVSYARKGEIRISVTPDQVEVQAVDEGPGIEDIELAMQEGWSTATAQVREMGFGAGMGLSNMKKYSDEFEITSVPGQGTTVKMHVFNLEKMIHPEYWLTI